jgi:hypothetical protein
VQQSVAEDNLLIEIYETRKQIPSERVQGSLSNMERHKELQFGNYLKDRQLFKGLTVGVT